MDQIIMQDSLPVCTKQSPVAPYSPATHPDMVYDHTYDDWWDGDSDDYYLCPWCNTLIKEYVPR